MTRTVTDKLAATIVEVADVGNLFPGSVLYGRIGLDVRIDRGSLHAGKRVRLHGLGSEEEVEIVGIEMLSNHEQPDVVRILCSKPRLLELPTGRVDGWTISEG